MPPSLPTANAASKVPSTSAWMLLLGLLTILLFVGRQVQPPTAATPPTVAGSVAPPAPRATLDQAARHYASASVAFSPSAAL